MLARGFAAGTDHLVVDDRGTGGEFIRLVQAHAEAPVLASSFRHDSPKAASIRLVWTAVMSNRPVTRYAIYCDDQASAVGLVDGTMLEWIDTACTPNTDYRHQLVVIDASVDVSARSHALAVREP